MSVSVGGGPKAMQWLSSALSFSIAIALIVVGAQNKDAPCTSNIATWAIVYGSVSLVVVPLIAFWAIFMVALVSLASRNNEGGGAAGGMIAMFVCCSTPLLLAAVLAPVGLLIWGSVIVLGNGNFAAWKAGELACPDALYRTAAICIIVAWTAGLVFACAGQCCKPKAGAAGGGADRYVAAAAGTPRDTPGNRLRPAPMMDSNAGARAPADPDADAAVVVRTGANANSDSGAASYQQQESQPDA